MGVEKVRLAAIEPKIQSSSNLRIVGWLTASTLVAALAFNFGKYSKQLDEPVVVKLPDQTRPSETKQTVVEANASKATKPTPTITRAKIVGIWAPLENGCGGGYGVAYTANGRFSDGDENYGEEGKWSLNDDIVVRESDLEYKSVESDDGMVSDERKVSASNDVLKLTVTWLDSDEMTVMSDDKNSVT